MTKLNVEWIQLKEKLPHIKIPKLSYPLVKVNKIGRKILLISDWLPSKDISDGRFLGGDVGEVFGRMLDYAIRDCAENKLATLLAIPYSLYKTSEFDALNTQQQHKITQACIDRIDNIVQKYKPDVVMFTGFSLNIPWINTDYAISKLGIKPSDFDPEIIPYFRGRLLAAKFGSYRCATIASFSLRHTCSQNPKQFKSTVNLLGFLARDLATAIRGKNLYTLPKTTEFKTIVIDTLPKWKKFYAKLIVSPYVAIDTETDNLNRINDNRLLTIQFALNGTTAYVLPWHHPGTPFRVNDFKVMQKDMHNYFENGKSKAHVYQNAKFDLQRIRQELGVTFFNHRIWDITAGEYYLDENRKFFKDAELGGIRIDGTKMRENGPYSLSGIALQYGGLAYLEGDVGKADRARLAELPLQQVCEYAGKDVIYPLLITNFQRREAKRRGADYRQYSKAVAELGGDMLHVFTDMEANGALVDRKYLQQLMLPNSAVAQRITTLKLRLKKSKAARAVNKQLVREAGFVAKQGLFGKIEAPWLFDIAKQDHQQRLFFGELGLKALDVKKNRDGKLDKWFVAEYKDTVDEVALLNDLRKLEKLINTYVKGIFKHLAYNPDMRDDRLRSNYHYTGIITGRSGSTDPNLQNIPSRGKDAKIIKRMFIAGYGNLLLKVDFNAHEIRGWGNLSNDKIIAKAFADGIILRRKLRVWAAKNRQEAKDFAEYLQQVDWFNKAKTREDKEKLLKSSNRFAEPLKTVFDLEINGDVHRRNYSYFFNIPPDQVTATQRDSVKAVVFGTLYGKGAESLSREVSASRAKTAHEQLIKVEAEIKRLESLMENNG